MAGVSPATGLAQELSGLPQAIQQKQMQDLLLKQQKMQTATDTENLLRQQAIQNPANLTNPHMVKLLQQIAKQGGLPDPTTMAPTSQGATGGQGPSTAAQGSILGQSGQQYTQNLPGPQQRVVDPSFIRQPLTNEQQIEKDHYQGIRDDSDSKLLGSQITAGFKSGDSRQVMAAVLSFRARYVAAHAGDPNAQATADSIAASYLQPGIADLSPSEVMRLNNTMQDSAAKRGLERAQAGYDQSHAEATTAMIAPRVEEIESHIRMATAQADSLAAKTKDMAATLPGRLGVMASTASRNVAEAARLAKEGALNSAQATFYQDKAVQEMAQPSGLTPATRIAAITSYRSLIDNDQGQITRLQASVNSFNSSLMSNNPTARQNAQSNIDAINKRISDLQTETNSYHQALMSIMPGGPVAPGQGAPDAGNSNGQQQPNGNAAQQPGQQTNVQQGSPQVGAVTMHNGKRYKMHTDGNWYLDS